MIREATFLGRPPARARAAPDRSQADGGPGRAPDGHGDGLGGGGGRAGRGQHQDPGAVPAQRPHDPGHRGAPGQARRRRRPRRRPGRAGTARGRLGGVQAAGGNRPGPARRGAGAGVDPPRRGHHRPHHGLRGATGGHRGGARPCLAGRRRGDLPGHPVAGRGHRGRGRARLAGHLAAADPQPRPAGAVLLPLRGRGGRRAPGRAAHRARGRRAGRARAHPERDGPASPRATRLRADPGRVRRHHAAQRDRDRGPPPPQAPSRAVHHRQPCHRPQPQQQRRPPGGGHAGRGRVPAGDLASGGQAAVLPGDTVRAGLPGR